MAEAKKHLDDETPDVYRRLGVRPVINAAATLTRLGGSVMPSEVVRAMQEASLCYVDMDALQQKVGDKLAALTGNEGAYVTCGALAGLYLSLAATLALKWPERFKTILENPPTEFEVLIHRAHRNPYDTAIRQFGVSLVEVGEVGSRITEEPTEFIERFTEKTLAIFYVISGWLPQGAPDLRRLIEAAHNKGVVVIVDAAAQLPPRQNLSHFSRDLGADLVLFSGGKGLRGPANTGLVVGRTDLIKIMRRIGYPNHGIGRMLKVSKEDMVGLLAAVERFMNLDHEARSRWEEGVVRFFIESLSDLPGVIVERSFPNEAGQPSPRARVRLVPDEARLTQQEIIRELLAGEPPIEVLEAEDGIFLNPMTLKDGEPEIIVRRLREILTLKHSERMCCQ